MCVYERRKKKGKSKAPFTLFRFLYKNGAKNLRFCESVHTDPHKNATKTEAFENAVKSGYPQKRRFLKTNLINVNAQKRRILKTLQYPTMSFTKTEQCERTKTDVFLSVFVQKRSSVNGSFDATKTDTNKNEVV